MKKAIAILLAMLMVFGLAACGGGQNSNNTAIEWPKGDIAFYAPYSDSSPTAKNVTVVRDWLAEQTKVKVEPTLDITGDGWKLAQDLLANPADGNTMMVVGLDALTGHIKGVWGESVVDTSKFQIVCGFPQPYPYSGCMLIVRAEGAGEFAAPFKTWQELEAYAKANPDTVNVADRKGSIMTTKIKSLFNQTGLSQYVHWAPTDSNGVKTGISPENHNLDIIIVDETSAVSYLKQTDANGKPIYMGLINCRPDDDFSYYPASTDGLDMIKAVPTFLQVFGKEMAEQYNVPNTSAIIVKAGTPADVIAKIKAAIDALGDVPESTDANSYYVRQRVNGGTSKYYTWPAEDILKEWTRLVPVIKEIEGVK